MNENLAESFNFSDDSEIIKNGYDIKIIEPGFDRKSEKVLEWATDKPAHFPFPVNGTSINPCMHVYIDANGKKRLDGYFD